MSLTKNCGSEKSRLLCRGEEHFPHWGCLAQHNTDAWEDNGSGSFSGMKQNNTHHLVCLRLLCREGLPQVLVSPVAAVIVYAGERPAHITATATQPLPHHQRQHHQLSGQLTPTLTQLLLLLSSQPPQHYCSSSLKTYI